MIWWCTQQFCGCWCRLFVGKWLESGRRNGVPGVGGDPCVPNEKSPKLGLCSLAGLLPIRPLAIRCGVRAGQLPFDTPRGQGAPSTIRCIETGNKPRTRAQVLSRVGEHPAPSGALRLLIGAVAMFRGFGQGAPSTIRCIETLSPSSAPLAPTLRQGAPSTIRCIETWPGAPCACPACVREHPAPQGAPSTIRCIETWECPTSASRA